MAVRRMARKQVGRLSAVILLVGGLVITAAPPAAAVNTVVVTTTADVVNGADGVISLREAVTIANADGDDTVITLGVGLSYDLSICSGGSVTPIGTFFWAPPPDEDGNVDGDLDHTASHALTIDGNGSELNVTCDFERAFDNRSADATLNVNDLDIRGVVAPAEAGIVIFSRGDLNVDGVEIIETIGTWNEAGDVRPLTTGQASIEAGNDFGVTNPVVTVSNSIFQLNTRGGVSIDNGTLTVSNSQFFDTDGDAVRGSFSTVLVTDSLMVDGGGNGVGGIDGDIDIVNTTAANNTGWGFRNTGNSNSGQDLDITNSRAIFNGSGGAVCSYCTGLHVAGSELSDNFGPGLSMVTNVSGPGFTIVDSTIADNSNTFDSGGGIRFEVQDNPLPAFMSVGSSTIARNSTSGDGGGIWISTDVEFEMTNSTVTNNSTLGEGGGLAATAGSTVTLEYVTLVENNADIDAGNLALDTAPLTILASVIALPGIRDNCTGVVGAGSLGYNQIDDTSCLSGAFPTDVVPAANPQLGALADNGGPTETREPQPGSPLIDASAACDVGVDQRGFARPSGPACDVGAVEVTPLCDGLPATITGSGVINGTGGPDVIVGSSGPDTITGFGGDDVICGRGDNDMIIDFSGADRLFGESGNDRLFGGNGNDHLDGGPGNDVLKGEGDDDTLTGGTGDDDLVGGGDDDWMIGGEGDDRFRGGPGTDTADYSASPGPVTVYINDTPDDGTGLEADDVQFSVEAVIGSSFSDVLIGSAVRDRLVGGPGFDRLVGRGGNDVLIGGPDGDILLGGGGNDTLDGANGIDRCLGAAGTNSLANCESDDSTPADPGPPEGHPARCVGLVPTITGAGVINGTAGPDIILGSAGPDTITGFGGDDIICGGAGNDVIIDFAGEDQLFGGDGNDRLFGGNGDDTLVGGPGHDVLKGENDNDTLLGDFGNDDLVGGSGDDNLRGGFGDDRFRGGPGFDTADYTASTGYILAFRGSGADDGPFQEADDIQESVEAISGSLYNDTLIGSNSPDTIRGNFGDDRIIGRGGNDLLIGGPDDDFLLGGANDDTLNGANEFDRCIGLGGADTTTNCEIAQP